MLLEVAVAELLACSPTEAVARVIEEFLGIRPSAHFLQQHEAKIAKGEIGFLTNYLSQWPGRLHNTFGRQRKGEVAMAHAEKIVSFGFLMEVPDRMFLEVAYREFFDRDVDEGGLNVFGFFAVCCGLK